MNKFREVAAIKQGTVIDHISPGKAFEVLKVLGLLDKNQMDKLVMTVGLNFRSRKFGRKDLIKIEHKILSSVEVSKIALIAPSATINVIQGGKVREKSQVEIPNIIRGIVKCPNPRCITNSEEKPSTKFQVASPDKLKFRCFHCERVFPLGELTQEDNFL